MSTRCQVKISSSGLSWLEDPVYLYHHFDGDPSSMLPLFSKAWEDAAEYSTYISGRCGKVASILCSTDPSGFEVEPGEVIHNDLDYWYHLTCINYGVDGSKVSWKLDVYEYGEKVPIRQEEYRRDDSLR